MGRKDHAAGEEWLEYELQLQRALSRGAMCNHEEVYIERPQITKHRQSREGPTTHFAPQSRIGSCQIQRSSS